MFIKNSEDAQGDFGEDVYEMLCGRGAYLDTSFSLNPIRPLYDTQEGRDSLAANPMLVPPLDRELFRNVTNVKKRTVTSNQIKR